MTPRERRYCRCPRRIASSGRCWQINVPKSIGRWGSVNIAFGSQYGQSGQPCPVCGGRLPHLPLGLRLANLWWALREWLR